MKKVSRLTALVLALCMAIGIAGCGEAQKTDNTTSKAAATEKGQTAAQTEKPKDITIRYGLWGSEEEQKIQKESAAGADKVYPGLKIEVVPYPDSVTFWQQLPAQVAAKTAPDIIQLSNEGHIEYIVKGAFAPLDNEINTAGIDMSRYSDAAKGIWTYDGKLYGIPMGAAPAMFFINKGMWDAAGLKDYPKTWEEVKTAAKALTKDGVTGLVLNIHEFHLTNYVLTFGGGWGNGKSINSEANVKALEFIVEMFREKLAITPKQAGLGWDGEVFSNKKGAMSTGGYWYKGFLKNAAPDIQYVAIPMPKGTVEACTMHSGGIVVLKDSADKLSAVKAAAYMASEDALSKLSASTGINPSITTLAARYFEINPEFKAAMEPMVKVSKDFGYPAETKKFIDTLVSAMESKILKDESKSVKEILDEIQKNFQ